MISAKEAREQSLILSKTELYELKRIELEIKRCILNRECSTKIRIDSNNVLRQLDFLGYKINSCENNYYVISL
jgi:hypothetical protein|nr:MAG TPA: hypothetical protein [Caudoviricetes sp.]